MVSFSVYEIFNSAASLLDKRYIPDTLNRVESRSSPSLVGFVDLEAEAFKLPVSSSFEILTLYTSPEFVVSLVAVPVGMGIPPVQLGKVAPGSAPRQDPVANSESDVVSRQPASQLVENVSEKVLEIPACRFIVSELKPVSG